MLTFERVTFNSAFSCVCKNNSVCETYYCQQRTDTNRKCQFQFWFYSFIIGNNYKCLILLFTSNRS